MNSRVKLIGIIIVLFFIITRLYLIDKDVPPMDVSGYAQSDECYYALPALDKVQYGSFYYKPFGAVHRHVLFIGGATLLNWICFFTLKIFGNNYWGLRMASVLISIGVLVLIYQLLKRVIKDNKLIQSGYTWFICMLMLFLMVSDFSFLFSNIVIEPTLIRMFTMLLLIVMVYKVFTMRKISYLFIFVLGCLSLLSWLLVYLTNAFIPLSVALLLIYWCILNKRHIVKTLFLFLGGALLGCSIVWLYAHLLHINLSEEFSYIYGTFAGRTALEKGAEQVGFIKKIFINCMNFFKPNFLNYNPALLIFFVAGVFSYVYLIAKYKTERRISAAFISFVFLVVFSLQSLFINDFFTRKILIVFPLYVIICFHVVSFWLQKFEKQDKKYVLFFILMASTIAAIAQYTQSWIYRCSGTEEYRNTISPMLFLCIIITVMALFALWKTNYNFFLVYFLSNVIAINLYYTYSFAFKYTSHSFKDAMIQIGKKVNSNHVVGGWSIGFRLYNDVKPLINKYVYYDNVRQYEVDVKRVASKFPNSYIISYDDDTTNKNLNLIPVDNVLDYKCGSMIKLYKININ